MQAGMECAGCDEQGRRDYAFDEIVKASLGCAAAGWGDEAAAAALLGVDMHPAKNAFQGLACLGSKKKGQQACRHDEGAWRGAFLLYE